MIRDTIDTINSRITAQLATEAIQVAGMAVPVYDQQEKSTSLILPGASGHAERFVIDNRYLWQSVHLTDGTPVVGTRQFGSFTDHQYNARFILIGLSKSELGKSVAQNALDGTGYVVIDDVDDRTLDVLQRYFQVKTNQGKNYDPGLFAFAIRYHIEGVDDDDIAELPTAEQIVQLPVKVPEPEIIIVPGPPATGTSGGNHTHIQITPSSVWLITHNLGYQPAGIQVYDSAGGLWWPDQISYIDNNSLLLNFGTASFAGKAYLS